MANKPVFNRNDVLTLVAKRKRFAEKKRDSAVAVLQLAGSHDVSREAIRVAVEAGVARELATLLDLLDSEFSEPSTVNLPPLEPG